MAYAHYIAYMQDCTALVNAKRAFYAACDAGDERAQELHMKAVRLIRQHLREHHHHDFTDADAYEAVGSP